MLFTTPGSGDHISGVILFDETIRQSADDGTPFPQLLESQGIIPGIKVDTGAKPLAGAEGETVTEGLDGLRERLAEYRHLGARFAKWRATYTITDELPSRVLPRRERARARALRRAVPGSRDRADRRARGAHGRHAHDRPLGGASPRTCSQALYDALFAQHVYLPGTLLKPNMVLSGYECPQQASDDEVADKTIAVYRYAVPAAVPGIVFLSGGQSDEQATARLERDEPARSAPVAAVVLVRPRAPGAGAQGVGRRGRQARGRPAGVREAGPPQRPRAARATTSPRWKTRPDPCVRHVEHASAALVARAVRALVQRVRRVR